MRSETGAHVPEARRVRRSERNQSHRTPAQQVQRADHYAARFFTVLLFVVAIFSSPLATVHANQQQANAAERALFDAANRERVAQGLPQLRWDGALAAAARDHAVRMWQSNTLSHQLPGEEPLQDRARIAGARYTVIAENVAEGPTAETIHSGWMNSPHHRANILDPELNAIGIAVAITQSRNGSGGMLFAVQDFSQSVASLNFSQQEREVSGQLAARGLQVSSGNDDARKTCSTSDREWFGPRPSLVLRFEASDLSRLPVPLEQKLQSGKYRSAAVGACQPPSSGNGFTHFRIAVLLY
jgi:uncharacterized protein YkwD